MEFEKKLTFVEHNVIEKNGNTYHRLKFKDNNGEYIESLVTMSEMYNKLVVEKDYLCTFKYFKNSKKNYEVKFVLMGVK